MSFTYRGLFKYSGLYSFYNSRLFSRGLSGDRLSDFDKMYKRYTDQNYMYDIKP